MHLGKKTQQFEINYVSEEYVSKLWSCDGKLTGKIFIVKCGFNLDKIDV